MEWGSQQVLYYVDDSGTVAEGACLHNTVTRTHSFTDANEVKRYKDVLKNHGGLGLRVDKRTDCHPLEDR